VLIAKMSMDMRKPRPPWTTADINRLDNAELIPYPDYHRHVGTPFGSTLVMRRYRVRFPVSA